MLHLKKISHWLPSLYVMQALPYALITGVAPILYKSFQINNARNAFYTSLFTLPWLCKPALAPLLETLASKRTLTLVAQFSVAMLMLILVISLELSQFLVASGITFFLIACVAAIHDMNSDGFYIISLTPALQAQYIGVRTLFYQIGKLISQGGLVYLAGYLLSYLSYRQAWQVVLVILAVVMLLMAAYHQRVLPHVEPTLPNKSASAATVLATFKAVFAEFFALPHLVSLLIFLLVYNMAETQLAKIVPLFLMDNMTLMGSPVNIKAIGAIYGGIGTLGMLCGVMLAGLFLAKSSLKRWLVPLTGFVGLTNIGYLLLSLKLFHTTALITLVILFAQFGYGLSNGAYMLFLLQTFTKGRYPMALYAIGTAIMGIGVLLGGAVSGYLQAYLGYSGFFSWILLANAGIVMISRYNSARVL